MAWAHNEMPEGIAETVATSSNETPCFVRLTAAFRASHSNTIQYIRNSANCKRPTGDFGGGSSSAAPPCSHTTSPPGGPCGVDEECPLGGKTKVLVTQSADGNSLCERSILDR